MTTLVQHFGVRVQAAWRQARNGWRGCTERGAVGLLGQPTVRDARRTRRVLHTRRSCLAMQHRYESCWPAIQQDAKGVMIVYNPDDKAQEREAEMWCVLHAQCCCERAMAILCCSLPTTPGGWQRLTAPLRPLPCAGRHEWFVRQPRLAERRCLLLAHRLSHGPRTIARTLGEPLPARARMCSRACAQRRASEARCWLTPTTRTQPISKRSLFDSWVCWSSRQRLQLRLRPAGSDDDARAAKHTHIPICSNRCQTHQWAALCAAAAAMRGWRATRRSAPLLPGLRATMFCASALPRSHATRMLVAPLTAAVAAQFLAQCRRSPSCRARPGTCSKSGSSRAWSSRRAAARLQMRSCRWMT